MPDDYDPTSNKRVRTVPVDPANDAVATATVLIDSEGMVYDSNNPQLIEVTDTKQSLRMPAVSAIYGEDIHLADGAFAGTPLKIYNAEVALWTASAPVGPGNFTAVSGEQNNTDGGASSAKWTTPNVGDTIQFLGAPVDLSNYVALTFWVYIAGGYSVGDTIVVYGWDGGLVGVEVPIEPKFNILQPGAWQFIDIRLPEMELETATVDAIRLRLISKSGQAPTVYFDDFQWEKEAGEVPFVIASPPGFEFSITHLSVTLMGDNSIEPAIDPTRLIDEPALAKGLLTNVYLGGVMTPIQGVLRSNCDFYDSDFRVDGIPMSGNGKTCLKMRLDFDSPLRLTTPADWTPGDPLLDFFQVTVRDNMQGFIRVRLAAYGGIKPLP